MRIKKEDYPELNARFRKLCLANWVFSWACQVCVIRIDRTMGFNFVSVIPSFAMLVSFLFGISLAYRSISTSAKSGRNRPLLNVIPVTTVLLSAAVVSITLARWGIYSSAPE